MLFLQRVFGKATTTTPNYASIFEVRVVEVESVIPATRSVTIVIVVVRGHLKFILLLFFFFQVFYPCLMQLVDLDSLV